MLTTAQHEVFLSASGSCWDFFLADYCVPVVSTAQIPVASCPPLKGVWEIVKVTTDTVVAT